MENWRYLHIKLKKDINTKEIPIKKEPLKRAKVNQKRFREMKNGCMYV